MKDPKVSELARVLAETVNKLNDLDVELTAEGVHFSLDKDSTSKKYVVKYFSQSVKYNEELGIE